MKVACPSCGAENPLESPGQEVVCISCFSVWTPDADAVMADDAPPGPEGKDGDDTYQGSTIDFEPQGEPVDPLNIDLGIPQADGEEETAFAMEALAPDTVEALAPDTVEAEPEVADDWAEQTLVTPAGDQGGTSAFTVAEDEGDDLSTYTRASGDIIQQESPYGESGSEAVDIDALSRTTIAAEPADPGASEVPRATEAFDTGASNQSSSTSSGGYDDPFADFDANASSTTSYDDPFADAAPGAAEPAPAQADPFAADALTSNAPDPNASIAGMEELDIGSLEESDDGGGFEVDTPQAADGGGAESSMDLQDDPEDTEAAAGGARGRRGGRGGRRRRGRGTDGKAKQIAGLAIVVVVLGGVALGQTDLGYFGINAILGDSGGEASRPLPARRTLQEAKEGTPLIAVADAPTDYVKKIAELETHLGNAPDNKEVAHELVRTLMRLQERYPSVYAGNAVYAKRLDELMDPEQLKNDKRLLIRKLLVEAKPEDAAAAMEQLVAELTSDPDDLYLMAKVARMQGQNERAVEHYKRALEKNPNFEPALVDMARIHLEKKEISEAKALFQKLLTANPNHSEAQVEMAQIALYEKNFEEATKLSNQALETARKTGDQEAIHAAYWLKALLADSQGQQDERQMALEKAIAVKPKHEGTVLALADVLRRRNDVQAALVRLQAAEMAGLKSPAFFRALIGALVASGKEEEARKKLEDGLAASPEDTGLLMIQAEEKIRTKHLKTAKAIFAKVIELNPGSIEAYLGLSELLVGEGRIIQSIELLIGAVDKVDEKLPLLVKTAELQMQAGATLKAKETMGQILKVDPHNVAVKLRFASLLKSLGIYDESVRYYEDLDTAGALEPVQTLDYAEVLSELGRRDVALRQVESVIASDPMSLRANVLRGHLNTVKGEYRKAAEDLQRALKIQEDSADALYYIGLNELAQDRIDSAISFLNQASNVAPDDLRIRFDLARSYTSSGTSDNRRAALNQYSHIIDQYEAYTSARDRKQIDPDVYLRRGRLLFKAGQHKKALGDFKAAMVLDPVRQDVVIEFARTLQTTGNRSEADAYLREVLVRDERNPAAHYYLGESLLKSGKTRAAGEHFKHAVAGGGADFPNAHRHLGFLYKEKRLTALACNAFSEYIRFAPAAAYDREEIARLIKSMCK
jgi:tetratricopeptide (TPR) repeat protein